MRAAVAMLAEDRRRRPQNAVRERQIPQIPQLLQSLRGMPGAAVTAAEPVANTSVPAGLPLMVQSKLRPLTQETDRPHVLRPALPPDITSFMFGNTGMPSSRPATQPIRTENQ